jgi:uncharacterized protein
VGSDEWPDFVKDVHRFDERRRAQPIPGLRYQFRVIDGEAHAGSKPEAFNRGLRFTLRPYMDRSGVGK